MSLRCFSISSIVSLRKCGLATDTTPISRSVLLNSWPIIYSKSGMYGLDSCDSHLDGLVLRQVPALLLRLLLHIVNCVLFLNSGRHSLVASIEPRRVNLVQCWTLLLIDTSDNGLNPEDPLHGLLSVGLVVVGEARGQVVNGNVVAELVLEAGGLVSQSGDDVAGIGCNS